MNKYFKLFGFYLLLISCNSEKQFDQYKSIENNQWTSNNAIQFIVPNTDTISKRDVFLNIRNNKKYEFSSLYLIAKIEFPSGFKLIDTLEYEMTDAAGNWLGKGFTDVKQNKLFFKENTVLSEQGDYKFNIQQATRGINDIDGKIPLKGITDVGLSIEKVKQ